MKRQIPSTQLGFTLIEVMMVTAVIAILAAIAFPTYNGYRARAERSLAQQMVMLIANRQAQYLMYARTYSDQVGAGGLNLGTLASERGWTCADSSCSNTQYTVTLAVDNAATPPTFTVSAAPKSTGLTAGEASLVVTSTGAKTGPWSK